MAVKTQKKRAASGRRELPPGVKRWTGRLDPKLAKMISEDRGVASGGRNIARRKK